MSKFQLTSIILAIFFLHIPVAFSSTEQKLSEYSKPFKNHNFDLTSYVVEENKVTRIISSEAGQSELTKVGYAIVLKSEFIDKTHKIQESVIFVICDIQTTGPNVLDKCDQNTVNQSEDDSRGKVFKSDIEVINFNSKKFVLIPEKTFVDSRKYANFLKDLDTLYSAENKVIDSSQQDYAIAIGIYSPYIFLLIASLSVISLLQYLRKNFQCENITNIIQSLFYRISKYRMFISIALITCLLFIVLWVYSVYLRFDFDKIESTQNILSRIQIMFSYRELYQVINSGSILSKILALAFYLFFILLILFVLPDLYSLSVEIKSKFNRINAILKIKIIKISKYSILVFMLMTYLLTDLQNISYPWIASSILLSTLIVLTPKESNSIELRNVYKKKYFWHIILIIVPVIVIAIHSKSFIYYKKVFANNTDNIILPKEVSYSKQTVYLPRKASSKTPIIADNFMIYHPGYKHIENRGINNFVDTKDYIILGGTTSDVAQAIVNKPGLIGSAVKLTPEHSPIFFPPKNIKSGQRIKLGINVLCKNVLGKYRVEVKTAKKTPNPYSNDIRHSQIFAANFTDCSDEIGNQEYLFDLPSNFAMVDIFYIENFKSEYISDINIYVENQLTGLVFLNIDPSYSVVSESLSGSGTLRVYNFSNEYSLDFSRSSHTSFDISDAINRISEMYRQNSKSKSGVIRLSQLNTGALGTVTFLTDD